MKRSSVLMAAVIGLALAPLAQASSMADSEEKAQLRKLFCESKGGADITALGELKKSDDVGAVVVCKLPPSPTTVVQNQAASSLAALPLTPVTATLAPPSGSTSSPRSQQRQHFMLGQPGHRQMGGLSQYQQRQRHLELSWIQCRRSRRYAGLQDRMDRADPGRHRGHSLRRPGRGELQLPGPVLRFRRHGDGFQLRRPDVSAHPLWLGPGHQQHDHHPVMPGQPG
ncbi:hypothetical protein PBOI14_38550 [Pseudomonas sp. Boi14]|nr:hypothetical protein PBOI14_38550 [Pseudomonas sp. Boi14]